jgi:hypothetical protein
MSVMSKALPEGVFVYDRERQTGKWTCERFVRETTASGPWGGSFLSYEAQFP